MKVKREEGRGGGGGAGGQFGNVVEGGRAGRREAEG